MLRPVIEYLEKLLYLGLFSRSICKRVGINTNLHMAWHWKLIGKVPWWCSEARGGIAKVLPLERGDWEVCENALVWPAETPSSAKGRGMVLEFVKLGEVRVLSGPREHLGSVIQLWASTLGSKLSLDISDSTEKVEDLVVCMSTPCVAQLTESKIRRWCYLRSAHIWSRDFPLNHFNEDYQWPDYIINWPSE